VVCSILLLFNTCKYALAFLFYPSSWNRRIQSYKHGTYTQPVPLPPKPGLSTLPPLLEDLDLCPLLLSFWTYVLAILPSLPPPPPPFLFFSYAFSYAIAKWLGFLETIVSLESFLAERVINFRMCKLSKLNNMSA
jgi:hypothetical protein